MSQDSRSSKGQGRAQLLQALTNEIRAVQSARDRFDDLAARQLGVNRTDLRCLDVVGRRGSVTAGELGREAGLTSGAVTAVLDRLEREGFVRRVRDSRDRRRVVAELTPEARDAAGRIYGPVARDGAVLLERFTDDQLGTVIEFLRIERQLNARLAEHLEPGPIAESEFRAAVKEQVRWLRAQAEEATYAKADVVERVKGAHAEIKAAARRRRRSG
jgi:DNA-binding MarR family transcriptional regulator